MTASEQSGDAAAHRSTTVQLRRYEVDRDHFDSFLAWWPQIRDARARYGMRVPFAYALRDSSEFVWAVEVDGGHHEFVTTVHRFVSSPERAAALSADPLAWLPVMREDTVDQVVQPVALAPVGHPVTVQLRRYEVLPEHMARFVEWWPQARAARAAAGFRVRFAFALSATQEFVWALEHDGDRHEFDAAVERFRASPERARAFTVDPRSWLGEIHEHFVDDVTCSVP